MQGEVQKRSMINLNLNKCLQIAFWWWGRFPLVFDEWHGCKILCSSMLVGNHMSHKILNATILKTCICRSDIMSCLCASSLMFATSIQCTCVWQFFKIVRTCVMFTIKLSYRGTLFVLFFRNVHAYLIQNLCSCWLHYLSIWAVGWFHENENYKVAA